MRVAEAKIIQKKAAHPDGEEHSEIPVIGGFSNQGDEIAATGRLAHQKGDGHEKRDLGQEHKLERAEMPGGGKGKRLLRRVKKGGDQGIEASKSIIDRGRRLRHAGSHRSRGNRTDDR